MDQTREFRALIKSYEVFTCGADPDTVVKKFYSNGLLTREEYENSTLTMLTASQQLDVAFKGLQRRVLINPAAFNKAVKLLLEEPALEELGMKMQS